MFFEPYIIAQGRLMGKKNNVFLSPSERSTSKIPSDNNYYNKKNLVVISTVLVSTQHLPLFSHSLTIDQKQKDLGKQNFIETSLQRKNCLGFPSKLRAFEFQPCPQPQKRFHHHVLNPWLCSRVSGFEETYNFQNGPSVYVKFLGEPE